MTTTTSDETSPLLSQNSNHQSYNGQEPDLSSTEQGEESKNLTSYLIYVNAFLPPRKQDGLKAMTGDTYGYWNILDCTRCNNCRVL